MIITLLSSLLSVLVIVPRTNAADAQFPQYTAVELAQKTEDFWNGIESINLTYRFIQPYYDTNNNGKAYPSVETNRWIVDFQTGQRAGLTAQPEGIPDEIKNYMWYFDGKKSYVTQARDLTSVVQSELEGIEKSDQYQRSGIVTPKVSKEDVCWQNHSYRCWFANGNSPFFRFSKTDVNDDNTFVEFVKKFPSSTPVRSINESGDVLWTFDVFRDEENKNAFPGMKGTGTCVKEITVNETKNYLVQEIRNFGQYVSKEGETVQNVSFFRVTDYLKIDGAWFPKRSVYGNNIDDPESSDNQIHEVVNLKVNENNIDFSSFKIPAFTPDVRIKDSTGEKIEKYALWGDRDTPIKEFTSFEEFLQYSHEQGLEILKIQHEELKRQKAENLTTRIVLCILGLALVAAAILLKRRNRKTKSVAEQTQD